MGTELVDWQMQQSACVRSRLQSVGMWQVLLEEGVLNQGETLQGASASARLCLKPLCSALTLSHCDTVDQELSFQDKYLFYRFLDDEQEDAPFPSEEEGRESQEELQDTLLLLSQIGPDAHMRMILRKQYESRTLPNAHDLVIFPDVRKLMFMFFSPSERTADDLEIIHEELLHIKALSHLSTTVSKGHICSNSHKCNSSSKLKLGECVCTVRVCVCVHNVRQIYKTFQQCVQAVSHTLFF